MEEENNIEMVEEEEDKNEDAILRPEFPTGRVKKIVKIDKEINKVTSEALVLISLSTQLFLGFLAHESLQIALQRKRKTVKLEHLRVAAEKHPPTTDFLLDSLPMPSQTIKPPPETRVRPHPAAQDSSARRIDDFFRKCTDDAA